jgi:uncharacterized membrane protein
VADSAKAGDSRAGVLVSSGMLARSGHMEYDRILFFSDAVMAIAITLLIVDLPSRIEQVAGSKDAHAAIDSGTELHNAVSGIEGFALSFAVIALFWVGHHSLFRYIKAIDRRLMLLNLLFLGTIAFLPYPTALLSGVSSSQRPAVIFYAVCAGSAGLVETAMWFYASHARVGLIQDLSPAVRWQILLRTARLPVVFGLSIAIAVFVNARVAIYCWVAIWLSGIAINRWPRHHDPEPAPVDPADHSPV